MQYKIFLICFVVLLTSCATKKVSSEIHTSKESVQADTLVAKTSEDRYHNVVTDIDVKQTAETVVTISDSTIVTVDTAGNVLSKERYRNVHRETNKENVKGISVNDTTKLVLADTTKVAKKNEIKEGDYKKYRSEKSVKCFSFSQSLIIVVCAIILIVFISFIRHKRKKS